MKATERILSLVSLIFGAVAAFASISTLFATIMQFAQAERSSSGVMHAHLIQLAEQIAPYLLVLWGTMLVLGAVLVVVGVGLYRETAWARAAAFRWSIGALAFVPFQFWLQLGIIAPRTQAMLGQVEGDQAGPSLVPTTGAEWAMVIGRHLLVFAPLPVMLLIFARRPSAPPLMSPLVLEAIVEKRGVPIVQRATATAPSPL